MRPGMREKPDARPGAGKSTAGPRTLAPVNAPDAACARSAHDGETFDPGPVILGGSMMVLGRRRHAPGAMHANNNV